MSKRELHTIVRRIEKVKTWQLVILLVMAGFVAATFLRLNNVGMVERRNAVLAADESGDKDQLSKRLYALQRYVSAHMNTDTGMVPLENTYKQAYDQKLAQFEQQMSGRSSNDVVVKVREVCDAQAIQGGWGRFQATADPRYVDCINKEWEKYPAAAETGSEFQPPSTAPYYHTYQAPAWSSDFAGWSIVVCGVIIIVIIARLLLLVALRLLLKYQYKPV